MCIPFVKTVCKVMESIAPLRLAEKWDNVGLLLESPSHKLKGRNCVLLTIDRRRVHHAQRASRRLVPSTDIQASPITNPLQTSLLQCAAEGISIFSPRSSLDSVWGGLNDWLAKGFGTGKVSAFMGEKLDASGTSEGAESRLVILDEPVSVKELVGRVKRYLGLPQVQVAYPSAALSVIRTGSMLVGRETDVYFIGGMSHVLSSMEVIASVAAGKHAILCGHTNRERGYLSVLAEQLRKEIQAEDLEVFVSKEDAHPWTFA
ncbi:NGG1 interacting factor 3-like protein [Desarmillaria tabescens]|uniref:NGG1 interacting factor 3-like protein n=1 Tax=Armillaria tabescens TaxID=1929756 RepID=A0AA39N5I2_ARMTA|nr:NGG1 interacting factor 3-like protein [Desarmillaria tabescens]KAK0458208.1 NGG1 interacting factor 3-like protein [Desarmillaria tabescens]